MALSDIRDTFMHNLDIIGTDEIEIRIRSDGKVLWVNTGYGCKLRICRIQGNITIIDERPAKSVA